MKNKKKLERGRKKKLSLTVVVVQGQVRVRLCQERERRGRDCSGGHRSRPLILPGAFLPSSSLGETARGLDNGALQVVRPGD